MTGDPCPHGIPYGERFDEGCEDCDSASLAKHTAEADARAFRARVVSTARALWVAQADIERDRAFKLAEAFERAADEYEQNGGSK